MGECLVEMDEFVWFQMDAGEGDHFGERFDVFRIVFEQGIIEEVIKRVGAEKSRIELQNNFLAVVVIGNAFLEVDIIIGVFVKMGMFVVNESVVVEFSADKVFEKGLLV